MRSKAQLAGAAYRWSACMGMPALAAVTAATFRVHPDGAALARALAMATRYGDEKVANRGIRVWHGATVTGP